MLNPGYYNILTILQLALLQQAEAINPGQMDVSSARLYFYQEILLKAAL